jgi:hypothetical protein
LHKLELTFPPRTGCRHESASLLSRLSISAYFRLST